PCRNRPAELAAPPHRREQALRSAHSPVGSLKYLLKIDLSCLDGQPSCPRGGASDQTERCEGPAAVPVESQAAVDGNPLRAASRSDSSRPSVRRQRPDDPPLAGAVAWGRGGGSAPGGFTGT